MLIKCDRHTKEDLELWMNYEEIDKANEYKITDNKIQKAIDVINETVKKKSYISVSWGKDSVVVAHICYLASIKIPMIWIKESPMYNPYCKNVRDLFLEKYPFQYHEFVCDYSNVGFSPFLDSKGDSILFHAMCDMINKIFGRRITGIRSDESGRRQIRMRTFGEITENTSCPIGYWKNEEVFAYLSKYDLPIHPNYAMLGGGRYSRDKIRVDCLAGKQGDSFGRVEHEREYYQDILNKIETCRNFYAKSNS
jgi:phosphoadenosine phosphosulfate reductase